MKQKNIWNSIASKWNEYKTKRNDLTDEFLKKGKVLDLGCGSGRNFTKTNATIYGLDFSKEMLNYAAQKAQKLDIKCVLSFAPSSKIPFENNFFDSAICIALLHCINSKFKRNKTIKELFRVLKPQAKAFITVWNKTSPRMKNKPKSHKVPWTIENKKLWRTNYLYEPEELIEELEKVGFKILKQFENQNNIMVVVQKPKN
jgi:tRNA (uracil-5-)-methyltransferase TRM9